MRTIAVIQARMSSTRLPGKILADIEGESMLARVVSRVRRASLLDDLIVATGDSPADDPTEAECGRLGTRCFRGSEEDVLTRFRDAAALAAAERIVRITADCPLIDPQVIDIVLDVFAKQAPDYASNTLHRTYPQGLDTEALSMDALEIACTEAKELYERAHVTPYIYKQPQRFRLTSVEHAIDLSRHRWTVDTQDDMDLVRAIYASFERADSFTWTEVLRLMEDRPELTLINRHVRQKQLEEG